MYRTLSPVLAPSRGTTIFRMGHFGSPASERGGWVVGYAAPGARCPMIRTTSSSVTSRIFWSLYAGFMKLRLFSATFVDPAQNWGLYAIFFHFLLSCFMTFMT